MTATYAIRSAKRERNRAALLAAAFELAVERGYHGVSVEEVAGHAGLTTGAVYSIFGGKRELFAAALRDQLGVPSFADVAELGTPLEEAMRLLAIRWGELASDGRAAAAYALGLELATTAYGDAAVKAQGILDWSADRDRLAGELADYSGAAGETLPVPAVQLATRLCGALGGLSQVQLHTGQLGPTDFVAVATALLRG